MNRSIHFLYKFSSIKFWIDINVLLVYVIDNLCVVAGSHPPPYPPQFFWQYDLLIHGRIDTIRPRMKSDPLTGGQPTEVADDGISVHPQKLFPRSFGLTTIPTAPQHMPTIQYWLEHSVCCGV